MSVPLWINLSVLKFAVRRTYPTENRVVLWRCLVLCMAQKHLPGREAFPSRSENWDLKSSACLIYFELKVVCWFLVDCLCTYMVFWFGLLLFSIFLFYLASEGLQWFSELFPDESLWMWWFWYYFSSSLTDRHLQNILDSKNCHLYLYFIYL